VYLTPSPGELFIGDEAHALDTPGQLFTIPAGTPHGTRGTGTTPRISIGPFNEAGRPVGVTPTSGFAYYDANRIDFLQFDSYALNTPYTVRSFSDVGGTLPSGQRFLGWTTSDTGTAVEYAVSDTALLTEGSQNIVFYPVLVTPPSSTQQQTTRPSNAVLSTANAMVNASAETASVAGIALVQARRSNPAMRFPDHASYLRYQQGIARVQIRRAAAPQTTGTPVIATAPAPPSIISVIDDGGCYNDGRVQVNFSSPTNTGGSPVLFYTVRAYTSVSGADILYDTQNSSATPETFVNSYPLSVDIPYTFRISATNAAGTSAWSTFSDSVVIPATPSAPKNVEALPGETAIDVGFGEPDCSGGFPILYYVVKTFLAADDSPVLPDISGTTSPISITGLTNGTYYYFAVYAVNSNGDGRRATTDAVRFGAPSGTVYTSPSGTGNISTPSISPFVGGGNSYLFNGSNSYLAVDGDDSWAFGTDDFTVEWFQNQADTNPFPRIFAIGIYDDDDISVACSIEEGSFYAWTNNTGNFGTNVTPYKDQWVHFAIVRSGGQLRVYKNGALFAGPEENTADISNNTTTLFFGIETPTDADTAFGGYLTNIRIVKGLAVYTGNFTVPTSALTIIATANPYGGSNTRAIANGFTKLLFVP
jgi:hypothetical protein